MADNFFFFSSDFEAFSPTPGAENALPNAPTTPDLISASDSGASQTDDITNVNLPTFTGTARAGSLVTISAGAADLGTTPADDGGIWSFTAGSALASPADACDQARIDWGILTEEMPVYTTDAGEYRPDWDGDTYQGERSYIPDARRKGLVEEALERVARNCDEPDNRKALYDAYNAWVQDEYCKVATVKYEAAADRNSRTPRSDLARIRADMAEQCRRR